ncbi:ATP-binding cassette domain-containing protein [Mucilaginibacter sp.]|uniref:ABC transporter ATP-binding protein n=1 Tax=Mucilaginibacter sp. TaxID=1882438 RepID=UPI002615ED91|nr:ABC transporter ATP-binding protein [Mucilaginibacter sp.]MDB4924713.1 transporter ATP-binding protein [Mucilaginibacter sp.]
MIKISQLTFGYGKQKLFDNLNLTLQPGHIYGLLGMNGAGKSTLLKNIAGLVFPWAGTCTVNGISSDKRLPSFLQELFFVPEEVYLPAVNAKQFADSTAHFYPKFDHGQYITILKEFDVPTDKLLTKLSFGQQKKVIIAFGLSTNTSLLVMDEPTNGLDIPSKTQFRKIIAAALTENRCIIISTHQVRDLDNLIDAVLVLHNQQIVVAKSLDEIAERISFSIIPTTGTDYIYAEEGMMGLNAITENNDNSYNKVDMELLFNAIITNNTQLIDILNKPGHE